MYMKMKTLFSLSPFHRELKIPNAALLDTSGSKMGTSKNILRYAEGEIVELPVTLEKFIDLNCFFTFGVKSSNTFIYSIIYAHDPGFRLLDGGDIDRFLTDFKMNLLDAVTNTTEKVIGKATVLKEVNADNYNTKEVILFMSNHLSAKYSYHLDLNENKLTMYKEFDHSTGSIVIIYSESTTFNC